jgi:hypothetical protein
MKQVKREKEKPKPP